jgi:hypothetical protein
MEIESRGHPVNSIQENRKFFYQEKKYASLAGFRSLFVQETMHVESAYCIKQGLSFNSAERTKVRQG